MSEKPVDVLKFTQCHEQAVNAASKHCHFKQHAENVIKTYLEEMHKAGFNLTDKVDRG